LKRFYFINLFSLLTVSCFPQGIINNGGQIVLSGAAQIYIDGGTAGDYLSQTGGIVVPSAAGVITMEGDWTNNSANTGFSADAGTVVFAGAAQFINGTNSTIFFNLNLQGSGVKTQNLNTSVGGVATTNGVLSVGGVIYDLNTFTLTMTNPATTGITFGAGYILSETNVAVNPSVLRWNMGASTGVHIYPFGVAGTQIPFTFNKTTAGVSNVDVSTRSTIASDNLPSAGASNVGAVTFFYCPNNGLGGSPCAANSVVDRWWDITPSGAVTADATFSYRGIENTLNAPYNSGNIGAQFWDGSYWNPNNATIGSAPAVVAGVGTVLASGLTQFCPYVLSSVTVPLPIELIDFKASCTSNNVILNWSTASEKNASHFEIMNSADGINFSKIASVNAAGNSTSLKKYSYVVENKNVSGKYFRLKLVDKDLSFKNSVTEFVSDDCNNKDEIPTIYYNQQSGIVITSISKDVSNYTLNIIDAAGRLITNNVLPVNAGYNNIVINPQLANGMYMLHLSYNNGLMLSKKIILIN